MWETRVGSLGWEDPQEKGKAPQSSVLAWRIPCTVQPMGSPRVGHDWATITFTFNSHTKALTPDVMESGDGTRGMGLLWWDWCPCKNRYQRGSSCPVSPPLPPSHPPPPHTQRKDHINTRAKRQPSASQGERPHQNLPHCHQISNLSLQKHEKQMLLRSFNHCYL